MNDYLIPSIQRERERLDVLKKARDRLEALIRHEIEDIDPVDEYKWNVAIQAIEEQEKLSRYRLSNWERAAAGQNLSTTAPTSTT